MASLLLPLPHLHNITGNELGLLQGSTVYTGVIFLQFLLHTALPR